MSESSGSDLIRRFGEQGVSHVFAVPGDYVPTIFSPTRRGRCEIFMTAEQG